mgnify:CR=1 FL=1
MCNGGNEPHGPRLKNGVYAYDLTTLPICGARTKAGNACKRVAKLKTGRCRLHGGLSTGPRTEDGLRRSKLANRKHGHYSLEMKKNRREINQLLKQTKELLKSMK